MATNFALHSTFCLNQVTQCTTQTNQVINCEVWPSLECDDGSMVTEILATHCPDSRKIDVNPMLSVFRTILLRSTLNSTQDQDDGTMLPDFVAKLPAGIVNEISCKLSSNNNFCRTAIEPTICSCGIKTACKCNFSSGGGARATTMALLNTLANYAWDAKVVLTVAAFTLNYGEFFLFAPSTKKNPSVAQSISLLKQLRDTTEHARSSKPEFAVAVKLVKAIIGVTKYIVDLIDLPLHFLSIHEPPVSIAIGYVAKAAYWTILSVAVCARQIASANACQESACCMELWDLSCLANEGSRVQQVVRNQLIICQEHADDQCKIPYWDLINTFSTCHTDSVRILETLISSQAFRRHHLLDRNSQQISIEVLRKKHVLLLISGLDLSEEEVEILSNLYQESQKMLEVQYQVVWIPVVEKSSSWNQDKQQKFEQWQTSMPWYTVPEPSRIKPEVIKYIKKVWNFSGKMILVPLDPQGRVQSMNALDLLWIWGNSAFPFSIETEELLWEQQSWTIELLLGGIDKTILNWAKEEKIICFYGGDDIDWIQEFTHLAENVADSISCMGLQLVYVGRNNSTKLMEKIIKIIDAEKLSYYWTNPSSNWFFWTRLESILYLKMQQGKSPKNDLIMRDVSSLLSYDSSNKGWALFCKGSSETSLTRGDVALKSLRQFNEWKHAASEKGFVAALNDYFKKSHTITQQQNRIILTGNRREIPSMEKCFAYHFGTD